MKKLNCNFAVKCITILLVQLMIIWNGQILITATDTGWQTFCTEETPLNYSKYCLHEEYLEIDSVVELKSYSGNSNLCENLNYRQQPLSSSLPNKEHLVCGTRQRPDLIFNHTSKSVIPTGDMGWRFSNDRPLSCNRTLQNSLATYFYVVYYCSQSRIVNHISQNEIALSENISIQVNGMEKVYISNTPAVAEAFESKRNPIWNRLRNDQSLFSAAKKNFCEIILYKETTLLLTRNGALLESNKSMKDGISGNNVIDICFRKDSSTMWKYHQHVMKNSNNTKFQTGVLSESLIFQYSSASEEENVVFAVPIRVLKGKMEITCGLPIPVLLPKPGDIITETRKPIHIIPNILNSPNSEDLEVIDKGQLAGAIVGALLALAVITIVLAMFLRYRKRKVKRTLEISTLVINAGSTSSSIQDLENATATPLNSKAAELDNKIPSQSSPEQYKVVNGARRKISTYSMREENIYCDLDDFRTNDEDTDTVGPLMGDDRKKESFNQKCHPKRKSATIMLNNDIYSVDNEAKINLVDNGKKYQQTKHNTKESENSHKGVGGKRFSVVTMVDNEMYSSSDDEHESIKTNLQGHMELKHLPTHKPDRQQSVKLPVRRVLSKVDEQSETSSLEEDSKSDLNVSYKDNSNIENPYEVSVNTINNNNSLDYATPFSNKCKKSETVNGQPNIYYEPLKDKGEYIYNSSKISSVPSCHSISSIDDWIESGFDDPDASVNQCDGKENPYEIPKNIIDHNSATLEFNEPGVVTVALRNKGSKNEAINAFDTSSSSSNVNFNDNESQTSQSGNDSKVGDQCGTVENPYEVARKVADVDDITSHISPSDDSHKVFHQSNLTENPYEVPAKLTGNNIKTDEKLVPLPIIDIQPRHQNSIDSASSLTGSETENISNNEQIVENDVTKGKVMEKENPYLLSTDNKSDYDADSSSSDNSNKQHASTLSDCKHRKRRKRKSTANNTKFSNKNCDENLHIYQQSSKLIEDEDPYLISCDSSKTKQLKFKTNELVNIPAKVNSQKPQKSNLLTNSEEDVIDGIQFNEKQTDQNENPYRGNYDTKPIKQRKSTSNDEIKLPLNLNNSLSEREQLCSGVENETDTMCEITKNESLHQIKPAETVANVKLPTPVNNKTSSDNSTSEISSDDTQKRKDPNNSKNSNKCSNISSENADTENPYEISCDKRPSIVTMVSNEVYSGSSSNESHEGVKYTDAKRPSITVMVQNDAYVSTSSDENDERKNIPTIPSKSSRQYHNNSNKRKSVSVKSDNYINTSLRNNKGRKVRYRREYEVIDEKVTSTEDELVVTKL